MYSDKLEELISAALQDGNLTEQKRNIIKRRAEKEGEDVEEVMMVVESRLHNIPKTSIKSAKPKRPQHQNQQMRMCRVIHLLRLLMVSHLK